MEALYHSREVGGGFTKWEEKDALALESDFIRDAAGQRNSLGDWGFVFSFCIADVGHLAFHHPSSGDRIGTHVVLK